MEFNEVKEILKKDCNLLTVFFSTRPKTKDAVNEAISIVERAIKGEDIVIDEETCKVFREIVFTSVDILLDSALTTTDVQYFTALSDLFMNIYNIQNNSIPYRDIRTLQILTASSRSISDCIYLLSSLLKRILRELNASSSDVILSRKYYDEFSSYLKQITHDDKYNKD